MTANLQFLVSVNPVGGNAQTGNAGGGSYKGAAGVEETLRKVSKLVIGAPTVVSRGCSLDTLYKTLPHKGLRKMTTENKNTAAVETANARMIPQKFRNGAKVTLRKMRSTENPARRPIATVISYKAEGGVYTVKRDDTGDTLEIPSSQVRSVPKTPLVAARVDATAAAAKGAAKGAAKAEAKAGAKAPAKAGSKA